MAKSNAKRQAQVHRKTRETEIGLRLDLEAPTPVKVRTGVGFFDHMLESFAKHSRFGLEIEATGDLHVDQHHVVEDVGIALGCALREALEKDLRVCRFAHAYAPLDDALVRVVVDISGRAYLHFDVELSRPHVGGFDTDLVVEFFRAFVTNAGINLHATLLHGDNAHHQIEALFKATALALRRAVALDRSLEEVPSTKGTLYQ
jgi:imidazoleglycerol-phosphate dehydratase